MKVRDILEKVNKVKELCGEDYDILALDCDNNTYDFKDIVFHEGLEVYGVKFE